MSRAARTPADLTELQLAQLARLAELGMEIAEAAGRQARGEGEGADGFDPALSFARAARAVRLTIALQQRLVAERDARLRGDALTRASKAERRRERIHAEVEQALEQVAGAEGAELDVREHLSAAAWERLTETDDADLLDRPIEEVLARICADLGVSVDWAGAAIGSASPPQSAAPTAPPLRRGAGPGAFPPPLRSGGGGPEGRRGPVAQGPPTG